MEPKKSEGVVLSRDEVIMLSAYVYASKSKVRTYKIGYLPNGHRAVFNTDGTTYDLTPERLPAGTPDPRD